MTAQLKKPTTCRKFIENLPILTIIILTYMLINKGSWQLKVEIIIDEKLDNTYIKIFTPSYSKDIENLQKSLENINNNVIVGFKENQVFIIDYEDIIRFYTNDKKIIIETMADTFVSRLRLYEIENRVDKNSFIKISRYEIINIDYVKRLDLSFKGTIAVEFKNNKVSYVSRRFLKEFKKVLGF